MVIAVIEIWDKGEVKREEPPPCLGEEPRKGRFMMVISTISIATSGSYCHHLATKLTQPIDKLKKVGYNRIDLNY